MSESCSDWNAVVFTHEIGKGRGDAFIITPRKGYLGLHANFGFGAAIKSGFDESK